MMWCLQRRSTLLYKSRGWETARLLRRVALACCLAHLGLGLRAREGPPLRRSAPPQGRRQGEGEGGGEHPCTIIQNHSRILPE
jgi:hypothetical protein